MKNIIYHVILLTFYQLIIFFIECDIIQGMIFKGKRSGNIHKFTMDVDPVYKYIEKFRGGVQWYMMEIKDIISSICFKLKNENNQIVSFNGQSFISQGNLKRQTLTIMSVYTIVYLHIYECFYYLYQSILTIIRDEYSQQNKCREH